MQNSLSDHFRGVTMYISELTLKNFRCFPEQGHTIKFNSSLNVIVGENDSGKSAIMDAIRIVLGTTDQSWYRIDSTDFHAEDRSREIAIQCRFDSLTLDEQAAFVECLSYEESEGSMIIYLCLTWTCRYLTQLIPPRTTTEIASGKNGDGPAPAQAARELLRVTYLKALRDAYAEMQSGRNSRLSQVMQHVSAVRSGEHAYSPNTPLNALSIAGIVDLANKLLEDHKAVKATNAALSNTLKNKLLLKNDPAAVKLNVAGSDASPEKRLVALLEKLDLGLLHGVDSYYGHAGLGTSSVMSMACELLLHQEKEKSNQSTFLLIEEPEEHIHAQRQLRLIQTLQATTLKNQQIILTTHSPLLASAVSLDNLIVMMNSNAFSMRKDSTKLDEEDYQYLERYLDATKANLFFARGVIIVEGPSEEMLLPTIATLIGKDLTEHGISIVNVRGVGLRRYAKIFQRQDETKLLDIPVACITDRDIMPDCAPSICLNAEYVNRNDYPSGRKWKVISDFSNQNQIDTFMQKKKSKADGQTVKTFISDHWTFEYDMALSGLLEDMITPLADLYYEEEIADTDIDKQDLKRDEYRRAVRSEINAYSTNEERASALQSFFSLKNVSKAVFAQRLAVDLKKKYAGDPEAFKAKIPIYLQRAIFHVTKAG